MNREVVRLGPRGALGSPVSAGIRSMGFLFVAGQTPREVESGETVSVGDAQGQTRKVLENLRLVLEAGGSSMQQVLKTTVFLTRVADYEAMNAVYREYFPADPPARSTITVAALAKPEYLVEIEAIALAD